MTAVWIRRTVVIAVAVAVGVVAVLVARSRDDGLAWSDAPRVYRVPGLSGDRVLAGEVVNRSGGAVYVDARRIAVVDGHGRRLQTAARFLQAFVHPLYAPMQYPGAGDASELQRLGVYVRIEPGRTMPLAVSWRRPPGVGSPVSIDLGVDTLPVTPR